MTTATATAAEMAEVTVVEIDSATAYRVLIALKFSSFVGPIWTRARSVVARKTVEVEGAVALVDLERAGAGVDRNVVPVWICA
jgi:hypothetical protein